MVLDEQLKWDKPNEVQCKKISNSIALLKRARLFVPRHTLIIMYNAFVLPHFNYQPRSQGFSLFVIGKAGKGPGTGRSHDFQHPDIVGVINYNNNEVENPRWPPT